MSDFPISVLVETTTRCPADCIICPNKKIKNRPRDMSWRLFRKIVDDCRGQQLKEFCPFIHGEPLSWKYFDEGLDYISQTLPEAGIVIYTNGYLLNAAITARLLSSNVREVHFSIDGLSQQVYEMHRRGLEYERVFSNVNNFLATLEQSKRKINTHVAFTVTEQNQNESGPFRLFWKELVDDVDIIPCDGRGGDEKSPAFPEGRQLPCFQTPTHTYILTDGSVVPCCKDWAGYSVMGNAGKDSISAIWNSSGYKQFRNDITRGNKPGLEVCRRCWNNKL